MIEPREGKMKTGHTTSGFTVIIPVGSQSVAQAHKSWVMSPASPIQ